MWKTFAQSDTGIPANGLAHGASGKFAVGRMGDSRLRIPQEFMLFGVQYEGENIWKYVQRLTAPTLDTPIESFSMLLRLSNLEPRRTEQDKTDYFNEGRRLENKEWSIIGIHFNRGPRPDSSEDWTRTVIGRIRNPSYWIQYNDIVDPAEPAYDLKHFYLWNDPSLSNDHEMLPQDIYWRAEDPATLIVCTGPPKFATRKISSCNQNFWLAELNAIVTVHYEPHHLRNWKFIQEGVTAHIHSFADSQADAQ